MKRLLIALLVCVYIATAVFSAVLPVTSLADELDPTGTTAATETTETTENSETTESTEASENTEATEETTESTESSGGEDPLPEETTPVEDEEPMSYMDFLYEQVESVYMNPEMYVGYTAIFNDGWTNFVCSDDPTVVLPREERLTVDLADLVDDQGNSIRVRIVEWIKDEDEVLWCKVEAVEGYVLPQILEENPYILQAEYEEDFPSLLIMPVKGMFVGETVEIKKQAVAASAWVTLETENLPAFFDVIPVESDAGWVGYDLGDVSSWSDELTQEYRYVTEDSVMLIPPEVTVAYETLLKAESAEEYEQIWNQLPETIRDQFTDRHLEDLNNRQEELNNVTHSGNVIYNGQTLEVSVSGRIPKDVTLSVAPVSYETVAEEGFDVSSATDLITALDIKLLNPNGTEWQPADGERIAVSIGVGALGIEDETVVRLHHKHGDEIYTFEVFIVLDGKVTVGVNGLSTFAVSAYGNTNAAAGELTYNNGSTIKMTVGQEKIFYVRIRSGGNNNNPQYVNPGDPGNWVGTWQVNDPSGAIYYEVYSSQAPNHNKGMWVAWIRVIALKETDDVSLTFNYAQVTYRNNNPSNNPTWSSESYGLNIVPPQDTSGRSLYLKDTVNTNGCITAVLVDDSGNEILNGLEGVTFTWVRKDGTADMFINPRAYENDYRSINVAKDHAGMVEARRNTDGSFNLVTYTVTATWADNTVKTATYTVRYQSEFLNADFELPTITTSDYTFYPNGWANLYWKTTAPGQGGDLIRDIEYGKYQRNGNANFGIQARSGTQFAELNAQEFGALYQDIISAPDEDIHWEFSHAARTGQTGVTNTMYVVLGSTEAAQKLTTSTEMTEREHLIALGNAAKDAADALPEEQRNAFNSGTYGVEVVYEGSKYTVWYHDATTNTWTDLEGDYTVPKGQYRTRLFFVSDPEGSRDDCYGNLIDAAKAGQYKTYLIEYFEQVVVDGQATWVHRQSVKTTPDQNADTVEADESGEALVYSSVPIENIDRFVDNENDHLYMININGENYPYDIRYAGDESLYIENYPGVKEYPIDLPEGQKQPNDYSQYDIVVHIFLRDTMVSVQKEIEFPVEMTTEQKLQLINSLPDDYQAKFKLYEQGKKDTAVAQGTAVTSAPNPDGSYTGFVGLDGNPLVGPIYVVEETETTELVGLELEMVTFRTFLYSFGTGTELSPTGYGEKQANPLTDELLSTSFQFNEALKQKVADVHVVNKYKEKDITINYVAVGNGKVSEIGVTDHNKYGDFTEIEPYYSGVVHGADVHPGHASALEGWYKDAACTIPVTSADGILENDGTFIPNVKLIKDVDDDYEVTFYAKFVSESIVINRTNAQPYENFVYHVVSDKGVDIYVTVACDENGNGSTRINEVPDGKYTVTEVKDWSWRYDQVSQTKDKNTSGDDGDVFNFELEFDFNGEQQRRNWLNGWDEIVKNVFKGGLS